MKRRMIYAFTTAMAISALCTAPAFAQTTGDVTASVLNVRSGDSTSNTIVGKLIKGAAVTIEEETENGWYEISYNGTTAYVSGDYVDVTETTDDTEDVDVEDVETEEVGADDADAEEISEEDTYNSDWDGPVLTRSAGTVQGPSGKETYYNLDMSGVIKIMRNQGYEGEYWVREDGVKMLGDYIMCAANLNVHPRGSLVESSLGTCIVCDTGGFASSNPNQLDIAVTW